MKTIFSFFEIVFYDNLEKYLESSIYYENSLVFLERYRRFFFSKSSNLFVYDFIFRLFFLSVERVLLIFFLFFMKNLEKLKLKGEISKTKKKFRCLFLV